MRQYWAKLECGQSCLIILNIYRSPGPATAFFGELQDILSYISTIPHNLALMGDFNLFSDSSSSDAGQLSGILESLDRYQYVDSPTLLPSWLLNDIINILSASGVEIRTH